jgi:hypothetical protein
VENVIDLMTCSNVKIKTFVLLNYRSDLLFRIWYLASVLEHQICIVVFSNSGTHSSVNWMQLFFEFLYLHFLCCLSLIYYKIYLEKNSFDSTCNLEY